MTESTKKPVFYKRKTVAAQQTVMEVEPVKPTYRMPVVEPKKPLFAFRLKLPGFSKIKRIIPATKSFVHGAVPLLGFIFLLILYVIGLLVSSVIQGKLIPKKLRTAWLQPYLTFQEKVFSFFDHHDSDSISRIGLIELAFRNMKAKRTRTIVTIGGMTIGIGAIVFLVSIGYGLQQLVITRVARLSEMKQVDIMPLSGGNTKITDKTVADVNNITNVKMALPLIAVVGRVNYQNSVSDMAVYGVTTDYLKESAIKPVQGDIFNSNNIAVTLPAETTYVAPREPEGVVAGAATDKPIVTEGEEIRDLDFSLHPATWTKVRSGPTTESSLLGYTRRVEGTVHGKEVWGRGYSADTGVGDAGITDTYDPMGKWIQSNYLIWELSPCGTKPGCEDGKYLPMTDDAKQQRFVEGYIAEVNVVFSGFITKSSPTVLGEQTTASESATNEDAALAMVLETADSGSASGNLAYATDGSIIDWVDIASEAGIVKSPEKKSIPLHALAMKQAVVNRAMLQVLGLKEGEAIGKKFTASFVVVGDLLSSGSEKIESLPSEYSIVAVIPDDKTPVFYVPFIDLRSLGVVNYSQMKVVVDNQSNLAKVRKQIESMGFSTRSVADTVAQINSLFATLRTVLALLGLVALSVAALGMFNTLTVSLLERTREVGLMKAMGMKSSEVRELFLTESMIMGFFGGVIGLVTGVVLGKVFSLLLSLLAIMKGVGFIDVSHIPFSFVMVIIIISFIVGIVTGIYPARRATKISALDALRYE